jgi:hypothetical protein
MAIDVKLFNSTGTVTTKTIISDDPSDKEIIDVLGGSAQADLKQIGQVGAWDVVKTTDSNSDTLIIGKAPYISDDPKRRESCVLSDDQVNAIKNLIDLHLLG